MKLLSVCATSILLVGLSAALADQPNAAAEGTAAAKDGSPPNTGPEYAGRAEGARGAISLADQARIVLAVLQKRAADQNDEDVKPVQVQVAALDEKPESGIPDGNGSAGCIFMEIPGSRIKEQRCYYPSEGERALNAYQFDEEIRYSILQQQQRDLQRSEAEATLQSYSQMFRSQP